MGMTIEEAKKLEHFLCSDCSEEDAKSFCVTKWKAMALSSAAGRRILIVASRSSSPRVVVWGRKLPRGVSLSDFTRNMLRSLPLIKSRHDQGHSISEEINKLEKERSKIEKEISEIDQSIAELHQRCASAILERERRNSEISELQLSLETMKEGSCMDFDKLFEAP